MANRGFEGKKLFKQYRETHNQETEEPLTTETGDVSPHNSIGSWAPETRIVKVIDEASGAAHCLIEEHRGPGQEWWWDKSGGRRGLSDKDHIDGVIEVLRAKNSSSSTEKHTTRKQRSR
ncbi:hypothetical protein KIN20_010155 [Parelaphostrongylus tenuis]|uniref:Uncharacterized protein n=1 Tax=Parelaphostrongylus tenuis TaxID=148309 RepID=A0AAD5MB03_PARTN|nr:hypothetical protein KIN20_010155 [Parelaphostrongylus tenuis]